MVIDKGLGKTKKENMSENKMKHYEFSRLAEQLNDLRKSEKAKEIIPILQTIREILISFYHVSKGMPMNLSDITDERLLEELGNRLRTWTIKRYGKNPLMLFIGEDYEESIIRLNLESLTFEKGYLEKKENGKRS